jgi:tetratricopeptide (TPR) repeat protein
MSSNQNTKAPEQVMAWAAQCQNSGRFSDAENSYRQIIAEDESYHPAWHGLGLLAWEHGQADTAVDMIVHAAELAPQNGLYQRNLGEMYRRIGRLDDAAKAASSATRLMPNNCDAHYNLGLIYTDLKDYTNAIKSYKKSLKLDLKHGLSWNNLGSALEQCGDIEEAEVAYAKAVALNVDHTEAHNNLGALYSEQGKLKQAIECFEAAIKSQPNFVSAHHNLCSLKKYTPNDKQLTMLELMNEDSVERDSKTNICINFTLGKAREDIGQFDRAFMAYEKGNALQHALLPVNELHASQGVEKIKATFSADFFKNRTAATSVKKPQTVFIVGMPRSGTTLIEQILSSHPDVYGAGELINLSDIISNLNSLPRSEQHFTDLVDQISPETFQQLGQQYCDQVQVLSAKHSVITDKMPTNFFYIGMIHLMFPNATIIHSMRDPMDSCLSCYSRLFTGTMEFAYDLGTLGRYYVRYIELMKHWHAVLPKGRILDVRYEEVVDDLEGQAKRMIQHLGIPWNKACLDFHHNERVVKTASVAQVRQPIYRSSLARWEHFSDNLKPLMDLVQDYR